MRLEPVANMLATGTGTSTLRVALLGGIRIELDGHPPTEKITRSVQLLLAYLLLHRRRHHPREVLGELFWGDQSEDSARACLSTALWRLRRILEPAGSTRGRYLVTSPAGDVGFNCETDVWFDVAVLEERAQRVLSQPAGAVDARDAAALEAATHLYRGDLLEGVYSDWALRERERLRLVFLNSLIWLMAYHRDAGAYEKSVSFAQHVLRHDPLREEIHREVMRLYLATGERGRAARQYEICREALAAELAVDPMDETQALYAEITAGGRQLCGAQPFERDRSADAEQALEPLRQALSALDRTVDEFRQAVRLLERLALKAVPLEQPSRHAPNDRAAVVETGRGRTSAPALQPAVQRRGPS